MEQKSWPDLIAKASAKTNNIYSNYVGNKRKILAWIAECMLNEGILDDYDYFIDLFGGSGNCSYFFNQLGKTGCITELLHYSHNMHRCMFSDYVDPIKISDFPVGMPHGVEFIGYSEISLADTAKGNGKKSNTPKKTKTLDMLDLSEEKIVSRFEVEKVAIDAEFKSTNPIFDNLWKVLKPFIARNLTAKEAFEICCYLTKAIMYGKHDSAVVGVGKGDRVKCWRGDSVSFITEEIYKGYIKDPSKAFIYLDPPYGADNSNSKYYKIYDVMECLSNAYYVLMNKYDLTRAFGVSEIEALDKMRDDEAYKELTGDIEQLSYINQYAKRFSGSQQFTKSLYELLDGLKRSELPVWIFSFSGEANFAPANQIALILQKYASSVSVYSTAYQYSYRKVEENTTSMGGLTIGEDADNEAGKRTTVDTEVLFICKR